MREYIQELRKNKLFSDIAHTYGSKVILILLGIVSNVIITRTLGVEEYGIYVFILTLITLGAQFGSFGLHSANIYYVSKNRRLLGMLLKNSYIFSIFSGFLIMLLLSMFYYLYPSLFGIEIELFVLAMCMIPLSLASLYSKNLLIGMGDIRFDNKITLYMKVLLIFSLIVCVAVFELNTHTALYISAFMLIAGIIVTHQRLVKLIRHNYTISLKLLKKISTYGFKAYASALLAFLVFKSDLFFVNYYLSKSDLSHYSLAVSIIDYIYIMPVVVGTILFQKLSSMQDKDKKYRLMKKITSVFTVVFFGVLLLVYLVIDDLIVLLYGVQFASSAPLVQILLFAIFFMGIQTVIVQYLTSIGFPKELILYWLIAFLANAVLNVLLIEKYGLLVVAFNTLAAYFIAFLLVTLRIKNDSNQ